ncbi:MAG: alpha/beta fold hydrolase [Acidimicrobiales bacterium]|nr:alpha/beta fold hydrolase [Acidimicrobiales bacterium]
MTRRISAAGVVLVLLVGGVLAGCSSDDDSGSASKPTTTAAGATTSTTAKGTEYSRTPFLDAPKGKLEDVDCWWDLGEVDPSVTVKCQTLTVPADWGDPDSSDKVVLPVATLHKDGVPTDGSPVVILHGGPGGALLVDAPASVSKGPLVAQHDLVLYDQRGSGRAEPSLNCPEKEQAVMDALTTTDPVAVELKRNVEATQACRDRLVGDGIDLNDYNTIASVNDLDALRDALGFEKWNVNGGSYGTRLGLAYARQHPDRVRALALDSVYPTQVGDLDRAVNNPPRALERLVDECSGDADCKAAFPDLAKTVDDAAKALDDKPGEVTLKLTFAGKEQEKTYHVVGSDFRSGMYAALYQNAIIPLIPKVIGDVANGDYGILPTYLQTAGPLLTGLSEGAYLSIDCADSGRLLDGATAEDVVGDGEFFIYAMALAQTFCSQWDVAPLPPSFNEPAVPDVPTIIFAGTLDPVTPYTDSKEQAEAMPNAKFVLAPRGGHGDAGFDDCTRKAFMDFLADPSADLPACVKDLQAPKFILGG